MPRADADRNLLFGITGLRNDLVARDALVAAMVAWAREPHRALGEILVERGDLDPADRDPLEAMVGRRLARHGDDPAAGLAAIGPAGGIVADLRRSIADTDLLDSLATALPGLADDPGAAGATPPAGPPPAGSRYRKSREHARGNLGVVYLARDAELNREVALKEIQEEHADHPHHRSKFLLEAEVTGGLEHPGIVPVYGLGHHEDGRPYYAMRFIEGDSLKVAIARFHADEALKADPGARALALQKLLRRFVDVCNAVDYAHSRGVLHRDLKPDNVMVGKYGETLVVDWGLAKAAGRSGGDEAIPAGAGPQPAGSGGLAETMPGSLVGTPAYMSPEQAAGRLDLVGPASDVYGLGATLYHLIVGRPSVAATALGGLLAGIRAGDFPRPRALAPRLDPALEAICLRAMALRPEDRYPSPRALADDLERWVADEPVSAHREPPARRLRRWARRRRTAVTATATAAAVAALLLGGVAWSSLDRRRRADAAGLATLARAEHLGGQARATGDLARWSDAVAEARRAEAQLEAGGGSADLKARARSGIADFRAALLAGERDRRMVADLEEARLREANARGQEFDSRAKLDALDAAFRSYGIDVASDPPARAAARIRSGRIAGELVAALEAWAGSDGPDVPRGRIDAILRAADPDPGRAAVREAIAREDWAGLRRLVEGRDPRRELGSQSRTVFAALARSDPAASLPLLEAILRERPDDFWMNHDLATAYLRVRPPRHEAAIRHYTAALALRPMSPGARLNLGVALSGRGEPEAAIAQIREAIRLKPDLAGAHNDLGVALTARGEAGAAIAEFREAIRLKPDAAEAHNNLGYLLSTRGEAGAAIAEFREAIRLKPDAAEAHHNLGVALSARGEAGAAIAEYREAIRLKPDSPKVHYDLGLELSTRGEVGAAAAAIRESLRLKPDDATAHHSLGLVLSLQGDVEAAAAEIRESLRLKPGGAKVHHDLGLVLSIRGDAEAAIAEFREALRLDPDDADSHLDLGLALEGQGRFADALRSLERGHDLGSRRAGWRRPSARAVQDCRRLVELDAKLPAILVQEADPKDEGERLALADLCFTKRLWAASARLYGEAISARPALGDDLEAGHRYNAACAASLAGSGRGEDRPPPDEAARLGLRERARGWLRADLGAWAKMLDGGASEAAKSIASTLDHWKVDADLAGVRDPEALARLPEPERGSWRSLWADVDGLRARAGAAGGGTARSNETGGHGKSP